MNLKLHINIALGYFLIIALLGVILRLFFVIDIPLNYKFIVHSHSHIALLGWVYVGLTTLIYHCYLSDKLISKKYKILFWSTQITLIGMLISFPIMGYAFYSILFSTLFLVCSYWFFWFFSKHVSTRQKETNSYRLLRTGLWFMVISSIGPWALGAIMNTLGNDSFWYKNAIYFYLHFQYNGWFIVTLFGLLVYVLESQQIVFPKERFNQFYHFFIFSIVLTFFISILWTNPAIIFNALAVIGSFLQLIAFRLFIKLLYPFKAKLIEFNSPFIRKILKIVILLFIIKMIMQLAGSFPFFANLIANHIDFAIGYLHWTFLGVVSISLLGLLYYFKLIVLSRKTIQLYLVGFSLTEGLIFYKGITQWLEGAVIENYYMYLVIASFIFLVSIAMILFGQLKKIKYR